MFVVSDVGEVINADNVFSFSIGTGKVLNNPAEILVAQGQQWTAIVVAGQTRDRAEQGLAKIRDALKQNWRVCDLRDAIGQRPSLDIAVAKVLPPTPGRDGHR